MLEAIALTLAAAFCGAWWGNRSTVAPWWPGNHHAWPKGVGWSSNPETILIMTGVAVTLMPWYAAILVGLGFLLYRSPGPFPAMLPPLDELPWKRQNWRTTVVRWVAPLWYTKGETGTPKHAAGAFFYAALRALPAVAVFAGIGLGLEMFAGFDLTISAVTIMLVRGFAALLGIIRTDARIVEMVDGSFYGLAIGLVFFL